MRVARALAKLPQTTAALARGQLTYSAVRELSRVATTETEASWLAAADGMAVNQIEHLVAGHQPGDQHATWTFTTSCRRPRAASTSYGIRPCCAQATTLRSTRVCS